MPAQSLTQRIGRLVAETPGTAIPSAVLGRARVSLLHNIAVGLAGRPRETVAHVMAGRFWPQPAEATLLHSGARVSAEAAAFANAALMNARSQDDTHAGSTSHPGSPTMAAGLAMAESLGRSGLEFLLATVLGYEALCRIGRDFDHLMTARGFRAAAVLGGFGATAAAARLLRLSAEQTAHALGLAANLAGGFAQVWREGSAEAPLQLAFAARNGIACARAASCGATAAVQALEGQAGFFRAFAGTGEPPREALDGLEPPHRRWQLHEVTLKPFPVCAILQSPLGVFDHLRRAHGLTPDRLDTIAVVLSPYEAGYPGIDNAGPFAGAVATKMSAQFSLGLAAASLQVTLDGLGRVVDPVILDQARKVRVVADPSLSPGQCRVVLHLRDGGVVEGSGDASVGQPDFAAVARFARRLAPEIGTDTDALDRLIHAVTVLEGETSIAGLIATAVACGPIKGQGLCPWTPQGPAGP